MTRLTVVVGDITTQRVGAIVNAANESLLGGGGVDGAIHRAAGPELLAYCRGLGGCPTGGARLTPGFGLPARWVIHTVGPVWHGGAHDEDRLLASCYRTCLEIGRDQAVGTIAFPSISTGVYRFPPDRAAAIAVAEARRFVDANPTALEEIRFVCFSDAAGAIYQRLLAEPEPGAAR